MSYAIVDGDVRYNGWIVDRCDVATFAPLGWGWGKDRERVFSCGCVVPDAKPASFIALDPRFGRDAERVYGGTHALQDVDVASFRVLGDGYAVDARHGYYAELRLGWMVACWTLETADPKTFRVRPHGWAIDRANAYCSGIAVPDADPTTLVPLTRTYATDGTRVFVYRRTVEGADAASFRALDEHYAIDTAHIYHGEYFAKPIAVADRATFRSLGHDFAADERYLYWNTNVVAGIEPSSVRVVSPSFLCTDDQVFYFYSGIHDQRRIVDDLWGVKPIVLDGADPTTFRDLGDLYGGDASNVWHHSTPIELLGDARRFESLGRRLARDDRAVYYETDAVDGADPASFAFYASAAIARDRDHWYRYNAYDDYSFIQEITAEAARAALDSETAEPIEDSD